MHYLFGLALRLPNSFKNTVLKLENTPVNHTALVVTLAVIIFCRNQLELWFEATESVVLSLDFNIVAQDYVHVFCAWLYIYLIIALLLRLLVGKSAAIAARMSVYAMLIILIPPLYDGLFDASGRIIYQYDFSTFSHSFIHLFNPFSDVSYVTTGVRIEIAVAVIVTILYMLASPPANFPKVRSLILIFFIYCSIYIMGYLPAIWSFLSGSSHSQMLAQSILNVTTTNSAVLWYIPLLTLLLIIHCILEKSSYRTIILSTLRIDRLLPYLIFFGLGFLLATQRALVGNDWINSYDTSLLLTGLISITTAFMAMTALNDQQDISIDRISNINRPAVNNSSLISHYPIVIKVLCCISLSLALTISSVHLLLMTFMLCIGYIYSAPPLRLRRFLILAPTMLTIIITTSFIYGSAIIWGNQVKHNIEPSLLLTLSALFWLACQLKDFKDIKGDKHNNVLTLPILLGSQWAYRVIGVGLFFVIGIMIYQHIVDINIFSGAAIAIFILGFLTFKNQEHFIKLLSICILLLCFGINKFE